MEYSGCGGEERVLGGGGARGEETVERGGGSGRDGGEEERVEQGGGGGEEETVLERGVGGGGEETAERGLGSGREETVKRGGAGGERWVWRWAAVERERSEFENIRRKMNDVTILGLEGKLAGTRKKKKTIELDIVQGDGRSIYRWHLALLVRHV